MSVTKRLEKFLAVSAVVTTLGATSCLTRPVGQQPPTTKVNFTSTLAQQAVDKVDLLFMIDNSASMGDKQAILADAVPNLLVGLLRPKCVDANQAPDQGNSLADPNGSKPAYGCPDGFQPEFTPVTDMHIGLISSSLGSFGGDVCPDSGRSNDKAHLLNFVKGGTPLDVAQPSNFLSWFPSNDTNKDTVRHPTPPTTPIADLASLQTSFQKLVTGVEQTGCGLEAQLESFYRFLIQPDPWVKVTLDAATQASLGDASEVDVELLQQRADFLREDSLVAIIELTDEDDSSADPLSVGGQGWAFMATKFPGSPQFRLAGEKAGTTAPRPTTKCAENPGDKACTSCGFAGTCDANSAECQAIKNDPNCAQNGGYYGANEDQLNVRFHRMKERYGIDPQYPIQRYIDGLRNQRVPDRLTEHQTKLRVEGDPSKGRDIGAYQGTAKCRNPLFAKALPRKAGDEVCNLAPSTRGADLVFFAVVGGVPNSLLHFDPNDAEKSRIKPEDWNAILGKDPGAFDYTGIDPHMIQSVAPRANIPGPSTTRGDNGDPNDPVGRDWDTGSDDLQYACTFDLPTPRTCAPSDSSCDCGTPTKNPPLCGKGTEQIKAKAYPTVREFMVVRALGDQGVIASLCPISLDEKLPGGKQNPTYGYNPAVKSIIDRLKNALTAQCLPQKLTRDTNEGPDKNKVPCLVLAQLGTPEDTCDRAGLKKPAPAIEEKFLEQKRAESGDLSAPGAQDLSKLPVCELPQLVVEEGASCKDDANLGWCYVENKSGGASPAGRCPQALLFSQATSALAGATFSLQCIQQFSASDNENPAAAPAPTDDQTQTASKKR